VVPEVWAVDSGLASKQQGGELAPADTTPRTKTAAVQITWLSPTSPRHPCRHSQRIHPSTSSAAPTAFQESFAPVHSTPGLGHPPPHDACCPLYSPQLNADNVTKPALLLFFTIEKRYTMSLWRLDRAWLERLVFSGSPLGSSTVRLQSSIPQRRASFSSRCVHVHGDLDANREFSKLVKRRAASPVSQF
jgi:hypothetical protein